MPVDLPDLPPVTVATLPRLPDWEQRLMAIAGSTPGWCVELAAAAVIAVVGVDPIAALRPYLPRSAAELLARYSPLPDTVTSVIGQPLAQPKRALRGDVALVGIPGGEQALGVIWWPHILVRSDEDVAAVTYLRPTSLLAAWPIGLRWSS